MIRLSGSTIPDESQGRIIPWLFGTLKAVPAIPIRVPPQATLSTAMTATSPASLFWIDVSSAEALADFPASGTVQIDDELILYTGLQSTPPRLTGILRGVLGTTAAAHALGTPVHVHQTTHVYVLGENPNGYLTRAVDAVYLNGALKAASTAPTHVVNLNDTGIIPGKSVVSLTFTLTAGAPTYSNAFRDFLTTFSPELARAIYGGSDAPEPAWPWWRRAWAWLRWGAWRRWRLRPISGGAGFGYFSGTETGTVVSSTSGAGGTGHGAFAFWGAPPTAAATVEPSVTLAATPTTLAASPTTVVRLAPPPILGTVTADVTGLQDTSAGTITGAASTLLDRPAWVTQMLLREAWQETSSALYDATWAATHAEQVADGFTWALRWEGMGFEAFREMAGLQGWADLFINVEVWSYVYRAATAPVMTLTTRTVLDDLEFGWSPATSLTTALQVTYGQAPTEASFVLDSAMQTVYGTQRSRTLPLPWITTETQARLLGGRWLAQWDHPRLMTTATIPWVGIALEPTDRIVLDWPTLAPFGVLPFVVRGLTYDLTRSVLALQLIEGDPLGLRLRSGYAISALQTLTRGSGYAVATPILSSDTVPVDLTEAAVPVPTITSADTLPVGLH